MTASLGTSAWPSLTDAVLFLEDIEASPEEVDRMLTTWLHAGAFSGVHAVVLGVFVTSVPGPDGVTLRDVFGELLSRLSVPVAAGLAAGPLDDNAELPFGRRAALDANAGCLYLRDS